MHQLSLRAFRMRGAKALASIPKGETVLLSGHQGPAYFLVPVIGDTALEEQELRRALARTSLRESWRHAVESGLDRMSEKQIDREIEQVRTARGRRGAG